MASLKFLLITLLAFMFICCTTVQGMRHNRHPRPHPGPRPHPRPHPGPRPHPRPHPGPRPHPRPHPGPRPHPRPYPIRPRHRF